MIAILGERFCSLFFVTSYLGCVDSLLITYFPALCFLFGSIMRRNRKRNESGYLGYCYLGRVWEVWGISGDGEIRFLLITNY